MTTVALLKTCKGQVIAVFATLDKATEVANRYNTMPDGDEATKWDDDAPYTAEAWMVQS